MAWVRLDDHFDQHPKLASVGPLGLALWVSGLAYCNRNLTDGFIPWSVAQGLLRCTFVDPRRCDDGHERIWTANLLCGMAGFDEAETTREVLSMVVAAGLWDEAKGGYRVHGYLEFQPSKAQVLAERARTATRQAAFRQRHRQRNAVSNDVSNSVSNAGVTPAPIPSTTTPPTPLPSLPPASAVVRTSPGEEQVGEREGKDGPPPQGDLTLDAGASRSARPQGNGPLTREALQRLLPEINRQIRTWADDAAPELSPDLLALVHEAVGGPDSPRRRKLTEQFPDVDQGLVALKLLRHQALNGQYRNLARAHSNWVAHANDRGIDVKES